MPVAVRTLGERLTSRDPVATLGAALLLLLALLGIGVALAGGGFGRTAQAAAVVGAGLLATVTVALTVGGARRLLPRHEAAWGVGLLATFAIWALLSTAWSVRPDLSLTWGALVGGYALLVLVAAAAARATPRARWVAVGVLLLGAVVVAGAALVQRAQPDSAVTIGGLKNAIRLRGPLDYWNALGLVASTGVLVCAALAADARRHVAWRLAPAALAPPLAAVTILSQSRGALVALAIALLVTVWCAGTGRLRTPLLAGWSFVAGAPLAVAAAGRVEGDVVVAEQGTAVLALAGGGGMALGAVALLVLRRLERPWPAARTVRIARTGLVVGLVALVGAGGVYTAQQGGPGDALRKITDEVASVDEVAPVAGFDRLLSASSSNRTEWWSEAFSAYADRPLQGWGAASFGTIRKRYRTDYTDVTQPHSLPLQALAETGIVGFGLLAAALWMLVLGGVRRLRELRRTGARREIVPQAILIGVGVAWIAQSAVDWHFDLAGVTIPALIALGVAASAPGTWRAARRPDGAVVPASVEDLVERGQADPTRPAHVARGGLLVATVTGALLLAVVTVVPLVGEQLAQRANRALSQDPTPERLQDATRDVALAADLDPLGLLPLAVGQQINLRRDNLLEARRLAIRGTERQSRNPQAWIALAQVAGALADRDGMRAAARRAAELDPYGVQALTVLADAAGQQAPPEASPTATGTPFGTP
ncbi:MAG: O-antigen ligase family protein [Solirubrobacteraceae bacterium]|nr:O-antigen ligase family protein [Solirubrobacteraceae bacterium]